MPLQNRVLPTGDIVSISAPCTLTSNRGIIHTEGRILGAARWTHKAWICCVLDWQGRTRDVMTGRNWTELFFLDDAVDFAAGHRPCGYCRRKAYTQYVDAWQIAKGDRPKAPQMDAILHTSRVHRDRTQVTFLDDIASLPRGAFIRWHDLPHLVMDHKIYPYTPEGYKPPSPRPRCGKVDVLTPAPTVKVMRAGYTPMIHPSAV